MVIPRLVVTDSLVDKSLLFLDHVVRQVVDSMVLSDLGLTLSKGNKYQRQSDSACDLMEMEP